jgi:Fic-DOC domain mobile mystery protein B
LSGRGAEPWFPSGGDGATPLDPDESNGLLPAWVANRADLNAVEQANINEGREWAMRRASRWRTLDVAFLLEAHGRLFGKVWAWAGSVRTTEKNIGVAPHEIRVELRKLVDDALVWVEQSVYPRDELVARFHHRLVWLHPFPNGNGRHARLMADRLMRDLHGVPLTWGSTEAPNARERYLAALRAADAGELGPLVAFIRS